MPADTDLWAAWGERIGAHAWPAFPLILAFLLLALALPLRRLLRAAQGRDADGEPQPARLFIGLGLGFGLIVVLAMAFTELAEGLGHEHALGRLDDALSHAIGLHTPLAVRRAFAAFTHAGDPWVITLVCAGVAIGLWRQRHRTFAAGWVTAIAGNALLNVSLKQVFERVRPPHDAAIAQASGYSFPSGHSSGAIVMWGMLAYLVLRLAPPRWHLPMLLLSIAMVLTTAMSRVFLQVHYLSDVLAGLCSGGAWLAVCIASVEAARHRRRRRASRTGSSNAA